MSIVKNREGAWVVSDIAQGYLVTRVYYGYSKREAVRRFKAQLQGSN